jgi:protein phosphatase
LLLRALNGQDVEPDLSMREARAGDRYLLCSDGLSGVVSEETLADALQDPDPQSTADRLIELALRSGGPDNITVIVADVVEDDGYGSSMDPVVDGAAGNNVGQRQVDPRSAAGRAALADPAPAPTPPEPPVYGPAPKRRRPLRTALAALAVLVVLAGVGIGAYVWALGHWFVGVDGTGTASRVAVFRGLPASVAGLDLYRVDHATDLAVSDLTPAARNRVRNGITADDAADAQRILGALRDQRLPVCPPPGETLTPAMPTSPAATAPSGSTAPARPSTTPGSATAPTSALAGALPTTATSSALPTTASAQPGVDCREGK